MSFGKNKPKTERCSYCGKMKASVQRGTAKRPYFMHEKCVQECAEIDELRQEQGAHKTNN